MEHSILVFFPFVIIIAYLLVDRVHAAGWISAGCNYYYASLQKKYADDKIIITKHNVFSRSMEEIEYMCEILMKLGESTVLFLHEEWLDKHQMSVSEGFLKHANVHRNIRFSEERVYADSAVRYQGFLFPIIVFGDWYGAFALLDSERTPQEAQRQVAASFAALLTKQQEH